MNDDAEDADTYQDAQLINKNMKLCSCCKEDLQSRIFIYILTLQILNTL